MASLNKVMIIGNLTKDPEISYTPRGAAVATLGIAINRSYTTESGERKEDTTFVDVELWNKLAELAGEYLRKGQSVYIEGRLKLDSWEDKQTGQKRHKLRVAGDSMQFLTPKGSRTNEDAEDAPPSRPARSARPARTAPDPDLDVQGDDIPF
jgi:single-strand DNA-binding protein